MLEGPETGPQRELPVDAGPGVAMEAGPACPGSGHTPGSGHLAPHQPPTPCSKTPTHTPAPRPKRVREAPCLLTLPVASLSQLQGNNHIQDTIKHEANPQTTQQHPHVTTQPSSVRGRRASTQQEPSTPARGPGLRPCSPPQETARETKEPEATRPTGGAAEPVGPPSPRCTL